MFDAMSLDLQASANTNVSTLTFNQCLRALRSSSAPYLEELDLRGVCIADPSSFLDFLQETSGTLHILSLSGDTTDGFKLLLKRLASSLPSLRTLRIDGYQALLPALATLAKSFEKSQTARRGVFKFHILQQEDSCPYLITWHQVLEEKAAFEVALRLISSSELEFLVDAIDGCRTPGGDSIETRVKEVKIMWRKSFTLDSGTGFSEDKISGTARDFSEARRHMVVWHRFLDILLAQRWFKEAESRGFVLVLDKEQAFCI